MGAGVATSPHCPSIARHAWARRSRWAGGYRPGTKPGPVPLSGERSRGPPTSLGSRHSRSRGLSRRVAAGPKAHRSPSGSETRASPRLSPVVRSARSRSFETSREAPLVGPKPFSLSLAPDGCRGRFPLSIQLRRDLPLGRASCPARESVMSCPHRLSPQHTRLLGRPSAFRRSASFPPRHPSGDEVKLSEFRGRAKSVWAVDYEDNGGKFRVGCVRPFRRRKRASRRPYPSAPRGSSPCRRGRGGRGRWRAP